MATPGAAINSQGHGSGEIPNTNTTTRAASALKQQKEAEKKARRREKETRRREEEARRCEEQTKKYMSWALKAAQAAIAVLCGYETSRGHMCSDEVKFSQFAAEVVQGNRETDMHDFFTAMSNINTSACGTMPLPPDEIRPLLRIVDGLETFYFDDSYDDTDPGCDSNCGYYRDKANDVFDRLSFSDLVKLCRYLDKHGFEWLNVSMHSYTFFGKSGFNYPEEQYISSLRHAIDIIISAANPTPEEMSRAGSFKNWVEKLRSDSNGWWATNKFVVDMTVQVDRMMYAGFRAALQRVSRG